MIRRFLLLSLAIFALAACEDDPVRPDGLGAIRFEPPPGPLDIEPFIWLNFSARHLSGEAVDARWFVDGELLAEGADASWQSAKPGAHEIRVEASSGEETREASWSIAVVDEISQPVPVPSALELREHPLPGSVGVLWSRPGASVSRVPIDRFLIHYSDAPFNCPLLQCSRVESWPLKWNHS